MVTRSWAQLDGQFRVKALYSRQSLGGCRGEVCGQHPEKLDIQAYPQNGGLGCPAFCGPVRDMASRALNGGSLFPAVLEARVRQLQAEGVSEGSVKRVEVARLSEGSCQPPRKVQVQPCGRWAEKLNKEQRAMQKRRQRLQVKLQAHAQQLANRLQPRPLRVEPRLVSGQLSSFLQHKAQESPWEEQLAQVLQEAPQKLLHKKQALADKEREAQLSGQQQKLLAFLECCLVSGHLPLAHHVLVSHHSRPRMQKLLTLPMYNTVMLGWARKVRGSLPRGTRASQGTPCVRVETEVQKGGRALLWVPVLGF